MKYYFEKNSFYLIGFLIYMLCNACGSSDPADPSNSPDPVSAAPPELKIVSGNNQSNLMGEFLTDPVIIKLTELDGDPISDAQIQFVPGEGEQTDQESHARSQDGESADDGQEPDDEALHFHLRRRR